jgi:FkbM family methyltransferase
MEKYSQNDEQSYILNYFNNNGEGIKYIEIGGFHPFVFSNTRALYELGASGVIVEPSPICMRKFEEEYSNEQRIKLIQAAITDSDGVITLYESNGDAISSTDVAHKEKWERGAGIKYNEITVKAISMYTFIKEHGDNTDFINIDVEGTNYQLFNLLPDVLLYRLKMICIEHDGHNIKMMEKLSSFGFRQILLNGENLIAVK